MKGKKGNRQAGNKQPEGVSSKSTLTLQERMSAYRNAGHRAALWMHIFERITRDFLGEDEPLYEILAPGPALEEVSSEAFEQVTDELSRIAGEERRRSFELLGVPVPPHRLPPSRERKLLGLPVDETPTMEFALVKKDRSSSSRSARLRDEQIAARRIRTEMAGSSAEAIAEELDT